MNQRLVRLHSLKAHRLPLYWEFRNKYKMLWNLSQQTPESGDYTKYTMNTQFAIINSKAADILTNTPQYDLIALDDDDDMEEFLLLDISTSSLYVPNQAPSSFMLELIEPIMVLGTLLQNVYPKPDTLESTELIIDEF